MDILKHVNMLDRLMTAVLSYSVPDQDTLTELIKDGYVDEAGGYVFITSKGVLTLRTLGQIPMPPAVDTVLNSNPSPTTDAQNNLQPEGAVSEADSQANNSSSAGELPDQLDVVKDIVEKSAALNSGDLVQSPPSSAGGM